MEEWSSDLTFFQELEEPMKCPICFDLMKTPVLLPNCEHNYCSLCIRKHFDRREYCPVCNNPASSNELRANSVMEKTIEQFKKIRMQFRSQCLNKLPVPQTQSQNMHSGALSSKKAFSDIKDMPRPKRSSCSSKTEDAGHGQRTSPRSRDRPASELGNGSEDSDSDVQILSEDKNCSFSSPKVLTAASQLRQSVLSPSASQNESMKLRNTQSKLVSPSDGSKTTSKENSAAKRFESIARTVSSREASPQSTSPLAALGGSSTKNSSTVSRSPRVLSPLLEASYEGDVSCGSSSPGGVAEVEKVPCPVCEVPVVASAVNQHLDLCLGRHEKLAALKDKRKPLPKLVYHLLSDKDLRKRLRDLCLSSKGDREALIKRHHEFTQYHNADCDSLMPKDLAELVKEFEDTEKVQLKLSKSSASSQSILRFTKSSKQEDIEKACKKYAAQHRDQFRSLIRETKNRMRPAMKTQSVSACSASLDNCTGGSISGDTSEGREVSDTTVEEERMNGVDIVVIDSDSQFNTDLNQPYDQIDCSAEVRTVSETRKQNSSFVEINDIWSEETNQEISESQAVETILSKTQTCSDSDKSSSDVLSDDDVVNKEACKDTSRLSSQQTSSTKLRDKTAAADGLGEEDSLDAFNCDPKSKCVMAKSSYTGKRALRSAKPSWQEIGDTHVLVSPHRSQAPNRPQAKFNKSEQTQITKHFNKEEKTLPCDSSITNPDDESVQSSSHTSEPLSFETESAVSQKKVLPQICSLTRSPRSRSKYTVTGADSVNVCSLRKSAEPSEECSGDSDKETMNMKPAALEQLLSWENKTCSDHLQSTDKNSRSKPDAAEEFTDMPPESRSGRTRIQKTYRKLQKHTKSPDIEKDPEACDTNVHALATPCEDKDPNSEDVILSSSEGNLLNDLPIEPVDLLETDAKPCSTDLPGPSAAHISKTAAECFELNLSDCDDDVLCSVDNKVESTSSINTAPQNDQDQELNSNPSIAKDSDLSHPGEDYTEYAGEADPSHKDIELNPETGLISLPSTTVKSMLKNKSTNENVLKKSVRFTGLRARLSNIQREEGERKMGKKKRLSGWFGNIFVSRTEATFLEHTRKASCHGSRNSLDTAISTQSEENLGWEDEADDEALQVDGDKPLEPDRDNEPLEPEGDEPLLVLEAEGDDENLNAKGDLPQESRRDSIPLEGKESDGPGKAEGDYTCEVNDCSDPSQMMVSSSQCKETEKAGTKQRKAKNKKIVNDAADSPVEHRVKSTCPQTCVTAEGDPLEKKDSLSKAKKKKQHFALPTDPADLPHLISPADEGNSVVHANILKDSVSRDFQPLVTLNGESDAGHQHREGDGQHTVSKPTTSFQDPCSSATEEHHIVQIYAKTSAENICAEESAKLKHEKSNSAKRVSQSLANGLAGREKPEDVDHPKSRQKKKRANSSVSKHDQQTELAEAGLHIYTAETAMKRRKTRQSSNSTAETSLQSKSVIDSKPRRRKTSQPCDRDTKPSR